jgi:hypothetical protein
MAPTPPGMSEYEPSGPLLRATVTAHRVKLNHWQPNLVGLGPRNRLLADLDDDVALADLTVERREDGNELVVAVIAGDLVGARLDRLLGWARDAGYRRVWLAERVICLEPDEQAVGTARISCDTCGVTWSDASPGFLAQVRLNGFFPRWCLACGGALPEWEVEPLPTSEMVAFGPAEPHG